MIFETPTSFSRNYEQKKGNINKVKGQNTYGEAVTIESIHLKIRVN